MTRKPLRVARGERVDRILVAARELFGEHGYEQAAVAQIAQRTGVVEGNVYKYFATKRELLLKVLDAWYDEMFAEYRVALAQVKGTRARLRLLVERHLRSVKQNPKLCRLMFREVRSEQDYPGSSLHAQNRRYTQLLVDVLKEGVAAGELRADLPLSLTRDLVYGGIEHHAWTFLCGRGPLNVDQLADQIADAVWRMGARK